MEMEKKNLAIIILAVVLAASGIGNVVLAIAGGFFELAPPKERIFNHADSGDVATLDPLNSWDGTSNTVLGQIFEPLFTYAWDSPELNYPHSPNLATSYFWDATSDYLTINLREGVTFHDGTAFNATTVEWNFLRQDYYCNLTGTTPGTVVLAYPEYLWHFADGVTPLWEDHGVINNTAVFIDMTAPFTSIVDFLTYTATAMVSPTSFGWDYTAPMLTVAARSGDLVGTGPYTFDMYSIGKECWFYRYEDWWGNDVYGTPDIDTLVFTYFDDTTAMSTATIAGDYDWQEGCPVSLVPTAQASDVVDYVSFFEETGQTAWCYCYIEMNTAQQDPAIRRALNNVYNWSYVIYELLDNLSVRPTSPVPFGMPGHDPTVQPPEFNITKGRLEMQALDPTTFGALPLTPGPATDAAWQAVASGWDIGDWHAGSTPYYLKMWVYAPSGFYATMEDLVSDWASLIGIRVEAEITEWSYYIAQWAIDPDWLDLWLICWCPDYINALNMLAPIMHPESIFNSGQNDDAQINAWLDEASTTTDPVLYNQRISQIQHRFVEVLASHIPFSYDKLDYLIKKGWKGCNYNAMRSIYYFQMYWDPD
ncbi:MAG: ABC transporter substrate-binding protein [Candidatus Hodarchaeota archaeon]